jgi:hypothetical protein
MKPRASEVWKHFNKINSESAKCKKVLKCKESSTSSLNNHLKTPITINETVATATLIAETVYNVAKSSSRVSSEHKQGLDSYIKRKSLGVLLVKRVANDGFSFHAVKNSSTIGEFINNRGYTMPKSVNTVIKLVLKNKNYQNYYYNLLFNKILM